MADLSFDDLIPATGGSAGGGSLSFDDLIPAAPTSAAAPASAPGAPPALSPAEHAQLGLEDALQGGNPAFAPALAQPPSPASGGELGKGFMGGLIGTNPKLFGAAMEGIGVLTDNQTMQDWGASAERFGASQQEDYRPRVPSFTNIHDVGDAGAYAGYQLGQGVASSLPSIVIGGLAAAATANPLVGLAVGAFGPSYVQNYGDVYSSAKEDEAIAKRIAAGEISKKGVASVAAFAAVPMAALDVLGLEAVLGNVMASQAKKDLSKRLIHWGIAAGTEGLTEGAQEVVSQWAQDWLGSQKPFRDKVVSVVDNVLGGMIAGAGMGAGTLIPGRGHVDVRPTPPDMQGQPTAPAPGTPGAPIPTTQPDEATQALAELDALLAEDETSPPRGPAAGAPVVQVDSGANVPESGATLRAQQDQLVRGERAVQMFPAGTPTIEPPAGMAVVDVPGTGTFHFNPDLIDAGTIRQAAVAGRLNDILGLGSITKAEAMVREASGETPVVVTERTPDGTEVKAAAGTTATAPVQVQELAAAAVPGNTVQVEAPEAVIAERMEGAAASAQPAPDLSFDDLVPASPDTRPWDWSSKQPPTGPVRLYRGEAPGQGPFQSNSAVTGNWFTTSLDKARRYGDVSYLDVDPNELKYFARGHGGADEFITDNPDFRRRTLPLDASAPVAPIVPTPGTRSAPIKVERAEDVRAAAVVVNAAPTEAQKAAGNYAKGHVQIRGLDIAIENPKGSTRSGASPDGKPWSVEMPADYGYIKRTEGRDGDHVDVYVGPQPDAGTVFVVDQKDLRTGRFDEHKVLLGFPDKAAALAAYKAAFSDRKGGRRIAAVTPLSIDQFKAWLKDGDTRKPIAGQKRLRVSPVLPAETAPAASLESPHTRLARSLADRLRAGQTIDAKALSDETITAHVSETKTPKSFWTYQSSKDTPSLDEAIAAGAIAPSTTLPQWEALSPGLRREIVRAPHKLNPREQADELANVRRTPGYTVRAKTPSLAGVELQVSQELFEALGIKPGAFWANYRHLAKKHPEYFADAAAAKAHVEDVLRRPDVAIPQRSGHVDLVAETPAGDRLIGFRAVLKGRRYSISTAYVLDPGQLDRMKRGAAHAGATILELKDSRGRWSGQGRMLKDRTPPDDQQELKNIRSTAATYAPPFYSAVERAIQSFKQPKAAAGQWLGTLKNVPGVKPEELEWLGLDSWLKQQKGSVTKDQLLDYVRANQIDVKEVIKGQTEGAVDVYQGPDGDWSWHWKQTDDDYAMRTGFVSREAAEDDFNRWKAGHNLTGLKYSDYTLPGGENYREMLLTLPAKMGQEGNAVAAFAHQMRERYGERWISEAPADDRQRYDKLIEAQERAEHQPELENYRSSHWDEPNILAHVRFNDRIIDGKKTLFVEEVQSDWHQAGKKKGYLGLSAEEQARFFALEKKRREEWTEQDLDWYDDIINVRPKERVPDAPFKTTWPELIMKRMIRWAAENGYDKIAWAPGHVQAERYDLSKQIERVIYYPEAQEVRAFKPGERRAGIIRQNVRPEDLPDIIGKEAADKIINAPTEKTTDASGQPAHVLSGLDLKVGGEGMKAFYDQQIPIIVNKLAKKYGAKVQEGRLDAPSGAVYDEKMPLAAGVAKGEHPVQTLDITPELRRAAVEQGFPLFNRTAGASALTREAAAVRSRMERAVVQIVRHLVGSHVQLRLYDTLQAPPEALAAWGSYDPGTDTMAGSYSPGLRLIKLALADPAYMGNRISTAFHESWHAAEHLLATAKELALLVRETPRLRDMLKAKAGELGLTAAEIDDLAGFEVRAIAFEQFVKGRQAGKPGFGVHAGVRAFFERVMATLRRIRAFLAREGFKTGEDVFQDFLSGDWATRPTQGRKNVSTQASRSAASTITFAEAAPSDAVKTEEHEAFDTAVTDRTVNFDVSYDRTGGATVSGIRVLFEPEALKDERGEVVYDDEERPVPDPDSVDEDTWLPARDVLSYDDFQTLKDEIRDSVTGTLEDRAEEEAERGRWDSLTPAQQQAETEADEKRRRSDDETHRRDVLAAVDASLGDGWRPEWNAHGGLSPKGMPAALKEWASPKSMQRIIERLRERGYAPPDDLANVRRPAGLPATAASTVPSKIDPVDLSRFIRGEIDGTAMGGGRWNKVAAYLDKNFQLEQRQKIGSVFDQAIAGDPDMLDVLSSKQRAVAERLLKEIGGLPPAPPSPPPVVGPADYESAKGRMLAKIVPSDAQGKRWPTLNQLYTAVKDDLNPIRALRDALTEGEPLPVGRDPYKLARLTRGSYGKAQQMIETGTFRFGDLATTGKGLKEILAPVYNDLDGFRAYMAARRVLDLAGRGIRSGFKVRDAQAVVQHGADAYAKPFADLVAYQRRVLDYLRDSGVVGPEAYKAMVEANKDYVPFFRLMGGEFDPSHATGHNLKVRDPIKGIKGSDRPVIDPIESIVRNTYLYVALAEKNRVLATLDDLAAASPKGADFMRPPKRKVRPITVTEEEVAKFLAEHELDPEMAEAFTIFRPNAFRPEPDQIAFFRAGKREVREVQPEVAEAVNAMDRETMGLLVKVLTLPARMLRVGATQSPEFIVRNPIRDQFEAFINTGGQYIPFYDMVLGLDQIFRNGPHYQNWLKAGGANAALVSLDRKYIEREVMRLSEPTALDTVKHVVRSPLEFLRMASELMENATRVGVYRRAANSGADPFEAGFAAREATLDFARVGAQTRAINAIIPFWNASVEGTDRMIRAFKDHPFESLLAATASITLPSILLWFANHDDDRYKELPQWQKDIFWIILTRDNIWRIPKPFTLGLLFGSVPERLLDAYVDQHPNAFKHLGKGFVEALAPNFVPQFMIPTIEQFANRSTFTDRPIVPKYLEEVLPQYQYQPYTSETAKLFGKALAKLGADQSSFASPLVIDNYVRAWGGGLGQHIVGLADKALVISGVARQKIEPTATWADTPVAKAFAVRYPSAGAQSIQDFYDAYEERKKAVKTVKHLTKLGETEAAGAERDSRNLETAEKIHKALGQQLRFVRDIWFNNAMTPDDKRRLIDATYLQAIEIAKRGNVMFRETAKVRAELKGAAKSLEATQ